MAMVHHTFLLMVVNELMMIILVVLLMANAMATRGFAMMPMAMVMAALVVVEMGRGQWWSW